MNDLKGLSEYDQNRRLIKMFDIQSARSYNKNKVPPPLWPSDPTGEEFARVTARFQKAAGLVVDGKFGPGTLAAYNSNEAKPKPQNYIIANGIRVPVDFKVVTWEQDPFWSAYPGRNFRWRKSEVEAFILHWDVTFSSRQTHRGLSNPDRDASVHFYIDEDGEIYQCLDAGFINAWHAGSAGDINDRSIGVEINNRYYPSDNGKQNTKLRKVISDLPVNGNLRAEYTDFHDEQKQSALQLADALQKIFGFPRTIPRNTDANSKWAGDDHDPPGAVLRGILDRNHIYDFKGLAGHFHYAEGKIDPGVKLFETFIDAGW